jgi:hypothetical protein
MLLVYMPATLFVAATAAFFTHSYLGFLIFIAIPVSLFWDSSLLPLEPCDCAAGIAVPAS